VSFDPRAEWLEADGLGGFASGTVSGIRTRRYHALLLAAVTPPTGRMALVNDVEVWASCGDGHEALCAHGYVPDVVHPDGASRLVSFARDPWPRWTSKLAGGAVIEHERFAPHERAAVVLAWRVLDPGSGGPLTLRVRPLISGRDSHALHRENPVFRFDAERRGARVRWRPYDGVPAITALASGEYRHDPDWYRRFYYAEERERGLDFVEDLASPGEFTFDLARGEAALVFEAEGVATPLAGDDALAVAAALRELERARRAAFASPLARAADQYLVRRGAGLTLIAGYPWFTDWGRDTFIALRGLCLATGRLDAAAAILGAWADALSDGMLPNRFPDGGEAPEYNSVDASLWFAVAVHDYLAACEARGVVAADRARLMFTVVRILSGYAGGARFGIRMDDDGLLRCGEPGTQLTWMDARADGRAVTPRVGKPVEVQALWINALRIGAGLSERWQAPFAKARESFVQRFWNDGTGWLNDVVDVDHLDGLVDETLRPNQVLALGGLPFPLVQGTRAHRVLESLETWLWTPMGLRSLSPAHPHYHARYEGGPADRDAAYHQGTVWPWLTGAFVEAWVHARGASADARREAHDRFVAPLYSHLAEAGIGHVSEIADGDRPHAPRGCPFQAWSLAELLRLQHGVLAEPEPRPALERGAEARS